MIPSSRSLVTLQPARQAALQAIMTVENARQRGARLSAAPHVRTFLRLLTGNSRMNTTVAQRIPGLNWEPLYGVMHEISFIVRETPESVRQAERWQVPNKLTHRSHG